jgi:hypothetical protein
MDEHCAAAPRHPRAIVVVDFDDQVVQIVLAHQPVARLASLSNHRTIIPSITGIFAPGIRVANRPDRKRGLRAGDSVLSPPQALQAKAAARGPAIALELIGHDAGSAQGDRECGISGPQDTARPAAGALSDLQMD